LDKSTSPEIAYVYLGGITDLNNYPKKINIVLAFGKPSTISYVKSQILNDKVVFPNIIHPKANIDFIGFKHGVGNVVNVGTVIGRDVTIGDFNMINSNCIIGHDVQMKSFNVISPQVAVSGNVKIHTNVFLGLNCSIVQGVEIEDDVHIGAKSLVLKKAKKGRSYFGIPALWVNK